MNDRHNDTRDGLRRWLANRADLEDVDDALWASLCRSNWMREWERATTNEDRNEYRSYLLDDLRKDIKLLSDYEITGSGRHQAVQRRRRSTRTVALDPDGAIAARAEAMCLYWAKLADASREVRRFRNRTLDGKPLVQVDAWNLIHSPAAAVMSKEAFRVKSIPFVGHTAELLSYEGSKPFEQPYWTRVTIRVAWPDGENVIKMSYKKPSELIPLWDGEQLISVAPWPFSVLRKLYTLAAELSKRYPWEPPLAAWYLLTGEPPWVPPLTAEIEKSDCVYNHTAITVKAAHWVPKDAVSRFYAEVKKSTSPTPTLSERRLALFRFVLERSSGMDRWEPEGVHVRGLSTPRWRELLAQWNHVHPAGDKWHYGSLRNFHRDFSEASEAILGY
jgi:hypothetical protein